MRIFLIFIFVVSGYFIITSIYSGYFSGEKNEVIVEKKVGLMGEIVLPIGLEKEYFAINDKYLGKAGSAPLKRNADNKSRYDLNKYLSSSEDKSVVSSHRKAPKKNIIVEKEKILNKVLNYSIKDEHLILDVVIFNNTNINYNKLFKINCDMLMNNDIVNKVAKNGYLEVKAHEKIRIPNLDLGFVGYVNFNSIICKIK